MKTACKLIWLEQIAHLEKRKPDTAKQRHRDFHEDRTSSKCKQFIILTNTYFMPVFPGAMLSDSCFLVTRKFSSVF